MSLFIPMLLLGLTTSIHCVAMCGSMVATYALKDETEGTFLQRMLPHFAYQSAKIASYMAVGLLLGAIGSVFNLSGIRGWVTIGVGLFMILLGLQMTGWIPSLRKFTIRPPKVLLNALMKVRRQAKSDADEGKASYATPVTFGLLTGLMPCAPLQTAQLTAATAGSAAGGALGMFAFGLGTMPLMLGFGAVSGLLSNKMRTRLMGGLALVVLIFGLIMLDRGANLVGSPVTFNTIKTYALGAPAASTSGAYKTASDGVVEVPLTIQNTQFVPANLSIPADKPVRLLVNRKEDNACSAQIAIPQLGVLANLKPNGITAVDVPASAAGAYNLTCGMGMMSGSITVGAGAAAPTGQPWLIVALAASAAAGGYALWRRRQPAPAPAGATAASRKRGSAPARRGSSHGGSNRTRSGSGSRQPRGGRGSAPSAIPALLAFSGSEFMLIGAGVVFAIVAGLLIGGAIRP